MNTATAKIFHDIAMNLSFEAKMAKTKGNEKAYLEYLTQAYFLEKEAALKINSESTGTIWQHALIRSAGWLAFKSGLYVQALELVKFGRKGNPPQFLDNELDVLEKEISQKLGTPSIESSSLEMLEIFGFLISANIPKSQIEIQKDEKSSITVKVPSDKIDEIVRMFWGQAVEVKGFQKKDGVFEMKNIKRAA